MAHEMERTEPSDELEDAAGKARRSVVFRVLDLIQLVADSAQPMRLAEIGVQLRMRVSPNWYPAADSFKSLSNCGNFVRDGALIGAARDPTGPRVSAATSMHWSDFNRGPASVPDSHPTAAHVLKQRSV